MKNNSKQEYLIREAVRQKLTDDDLKFLNSRLSQRYGGDLADCLTLIEDSYPDINRLLSSTVNADAVYDIVDSLQTAVQDEWKRRFAPSNRAPV
jgi:hypothetical protein